MPRLSKHQPERGDARTRLLDAARALIRAQGFAATSVDQLCRAAGVTKGAFFHQFTSKEALGVAAADDWTRQTSAFFELAPHHALPEPLDRVLAYIDLRTRMIEGDPAEFTCLAGTMAQELFASSPAIRDACARSIFGHAGTLEPDIAAAMQAHGITGDWTAASLARHTQAVVQGAFVLAKAADDPRIARESLDHLRRYVLLLFSGAPSVDAPSPQPSSTP